MTSRAVTLSTRGLSRHWGEFRANDDIDLSFAPGARHALIGPNGAGKTTLVNLLCGVLAPTSGQVLLDGRDITGLAQHERARLGIARTFQINSLFAGLTVLESVLLAMGEHSGRHRIWWRALVHERHSVTEAMALLERLRLDRDAATLTRYLPYGRQRLLEIALALAGRPRVLLLDEPAAGIPAAESAELFRAIDALPQEMSIVLIEHDMDLVFRFARRISVLLAGSVLCEGTPDEIGKDQQVREVYLGET